MGYAVVRKAYDHKEMGREALERSVKPISTM